MKKKMSNRDKTFWAVVIPVVVLFFAFNTLPMIKGVIYSFTNYKGYGSYDYVGLRNYTDLFTDARVGKSYLFTFKYAIAGTVLVNVLSLVMAVALNSNIRGKSALRGIYFVPNILGGLVIGYIFSFIFTYILPAVGNTFNISFLQNSILASEKYAWIGEPKCEFRAESNPIDNIVQGNFTWNITVTETNPLKYMLARIAFSVEGLSFYTE